MNIQVTHTLRPALRSDARDLAKLIDIAGEGIPNWLWSKSATSTQTALDIGVERAQRTEGGFSFSNAIIAENAARTAGMLLSYAIDEAPLENPADLPAPIAPFVELEKHSVNTWYINALAVFAEQRGAGVGSAFLRQAETLARQNGKTTMSIQVYAQNTGAVRLYQRHGYALRAKAPVQDHPCQPYYTGDVLLLIKEI